MILPSLALILLTFGSCTSEKKVSDSSESNKLNYQVVRKDEKTLAREINAARGKEKYGLLCQLADLKARDRLCGEESLLTELSSQARETFGPDSAEMSESLSRQGKFYFAHKDYARSAKLFEDADNIYARKGLDWQCKRMDTLSGQIAGECAGGKCLQKVPLYEELLALRRKCLGNNDSQTVIAVMQLGEIYTKQRRYSEALKLFEEVYAHSLSGTKEDQAAASLNLARTYTNLNQYKKAEPMLRSILAYAESHPLYGRINPVHISALRAYLQFYDRQKRYKEEVVVARRIVELNEAQMGPEHPQLTSSLMLYAEALEKVSKLKESEVIKNRIRRIEMAGNTAQPPGK